MNANTRFIRRKLIWKSKNMMNKVVSVEEINANRSGFVREDNMNAYTRQALRRLSCQLSAAADLYPFNPCDIARISICARTLADISLRASGALASLSDASLGGIDAARDDLDEIDRGITAAKVNAEKENLLEPSKENRCIRCNCIIDQYERFCGGCI